MPSPSAGKTPGAYQAQLSNQQYQERPQAPRTGGLEGQNLESADHEEIRQ